MTLTLRFWGTRGSIPSPGAHTARYGGNTPCVEVRSASGALLILDAGTGIRALGHALDAGADGAPVEADLFLSHPHWDHIQGIPFFTPLYRAGNRVRIWSGAGTAGSVERMMREQMSPPGFPVAFDALEATVEFGVLEGILTGKDFRVESIDLRHPGGSVGYKIEDGNAGGGGLVYLSDNELGDAPGYATDPGWRSRLVAFARGASVLVHDAMYTAEEYGMHRGWGHSHDGQAVELALEAGARRLVLFHHDPDRSDRDIDARVAACRALASGRGELEIMAAAEGMRLTI
jgi:phosphoribosyl 1,2-cyclic phosphodiesterase